MGLTDGAVVIDIVNVHTFPRFKGRAHDSPVRPSQILIFKGRRREQVTSLYLLALDKKKTSR